MSNIILVIPIVVGLAVGLGAGYYWRKKVARSKSNSIEAKADKILTEAKTKYQESVLSAKEKTVQIMEEAKRELGRSSGSMVQ